jgi:hypothetical protein
VQIIVADVKNYITFLLLNVNIPASIQELSGSYLGPETFYPD